MKCSEKLKSNLKKKRVNLKIKTLLFGNNVRRGSHKNYNLSPSFRNRLHLPLSLYSHMLSNSFKSPSDIVNPMVNWILTALYFENVPEGFPVLNYFSTFGKSLW